MKRCYKTADVFVLLDNPVHNFGLGGSRKVYRPTNLSSLELLAVALVVGESHSARCKIFHPLRACFEKGWDGYWRSNRGGTRFGSLRQVLSSIPIICSANAVENPRLYQAQC